MDNKLERRQCVKCEDYFTIVKTEKQDICYICEDEVNIQNDYWEKHWL